MKMRKAPSIAMRVEGELEIKINELHISKNIALLEFYVSLNEWIKKIKKKTKLWSIDITPRSMKRANPLFH